MCNLDCLQGFSSSKKLCNFSNFAANRKSLEENNICVTICT